MTLFEHVKLSLDQIDKHQKSIVRMEQRIGRLKTINADAALLNSARNVVEEMNLELHQMLKAHYVTTKNARALQSNLEDFVPVMPERAGQIVPVEPVY